MNRPFYNDFAWAYDVIIEPPTSQRLNFIHDMLCQHNVSPGSKIVDAGCGTGSYAVAFAERGYAVTGVDASAALLAVAREKAEALSSPANFVMADILTFSSSTTFDGMLCRGVLNDIVDDDRRQKALGTFGRVLRERGVLILDVREWAATAARKTQHPVFEKVVEVNEARLTFRSVTRLDGRTQQLLVSEQHTLERDGEKFASAYNFVMRCWTKEELNDRLGTAGFDSVLYFGDYNHAVSLGMNDRIVAVASRQR